MSEVSKGNRKIFLVAAAILAIGIVAGGYLLGDGLKRARLADRAVTMRGLAERNVTADLATWTISFTAQGSELGEVQAESDRDAATVHRLLPRRRLSRRGGDRRRRLGEPVLRHQPRRQQRHRHPPHPAAHHRRDAGARGPMRASSS